MFCWTCCPPGLMLRIESLNSSSPTWQTELKSFAPAPTTLRLHWLPAVYLRDQLPKLSSRRFALLFFTILWGLYMQKIAIGKSCLEKLRYNLRITSQFVPFDCNNLNLYRSLFEKHPVYEIYVNGNITSLKLWLSNKGHIQEDEKEFMLFICNSLNLD